MARRSYRIRVQGKQRQEIDVALFVQALLAVAEQEAGDVDDGCPNHSIADGTSMEKPLESYGFVEE